MGDKTGIEWTDATWNPVTGCTKVSQGCKFCYAETVAERFWAKQYPPNEDGTPRKFTDVRLHPERLDQPSHWRKPRRIFVNSMSDLFHEQVPDEFIWQVFREMTFGNRRHTYQILTKRPQRMFDWFQKYQDQFWNYHAPDEPQREYCSVPWPDPCIWLGVSVEDQKAADERIPWLLKTPAAVRFLSCEPLLGPVNLMNYFHQWQPDRPGLHPLDWVICGGESGQHARPMHPNWARSLRDQCKRAGVPFFFKQWGEWLVSSHMKQGVHSDTGVWAWPWKKDDDTTMVIRTGKKAAGRLLDGREWNEFPEVE